MASYSGTQKLEFGRRVGNDWEDLADYFQVALDKKAAFPPGREARSLWEWLEQRQRLAELPEALEYIQRPDLALLLSQSEPVAAASREPVWQGSPYPGLRPLKSEEAPIFFGRERETRELLERLLRDRVAAVVGASGCGKSSLVAAGVIPLLEQQEKNWRIARFTPAEAGDDPFLPLAYALMGALSLSQETPAQLARRLERTGRLDLGPNGSPPASPLLLVADQFEELFTGVAEGYRHRFTLLLERARDVPCLHLLLTLRADFYDHCLAHPALTRLLRTGSYPLHAPDLLALSEMLHGPARLAGVSFEPGLAERILRDTGTAPGALAVMAFALENLYQQCPAGAPLSRAAYEGFGGVAGAIGQRAEQVFDALSTTAQERWKQVFSQLVEVDPETGSPTRRRAGYPGLGELAGAPELIEAFTQARLLTRGDPEGAHDTLEVAHEALFSHWPRLHQWIEERFDDLRTLRQLRSEVADWERRGADPQELHRHERLAHFYEALERLGSPPLSDQERAYLRPEEERIWAALNDPDTPATERALLGDRLAAIGDRRPGVGLDERGLPDIVWCPVPPGEVVLEEKAGKFPVEACQIAKYPVTWAQYRAFLEAEDGFRDPTCWKGLYSEREKQPGHQFRRLDNHPAENVSWYDAMAFCAWLTRRLGYPVRLPTEWEWQQAATGGTHQEYPWPGEWDQRRANTWESGVSRITAVGIFPAGAAPNGALDLAGNVLEWCLNAYESPADDQPGSDVDRVVRGGSWLDDQELARAAYRDHYHPGLRNDYLGFRLLCLAPI